MQKKRVVLIRRGGSKGFIQMGKWRLGVVGGCSIWVFGGCVGGEKVSVGRVVLGPNKQMCFYSHAACDTQHLFLLSFI